MEKIANLKDIKKGQSLSFTYKGQRALLVRPKKGGPAAYVSVCPHEGGNIEWDEKINMVLCECHLSLFNVSDGTLYRHSSAFELNEGLTKIDLKIDDHKDIFTL